MPFTKLIPMICLLAVSEICFSQTAGVQPDTRLFTKYEPGYIDNLLANNPEAVEYLNFFVAEAWIIMDKPEKEINALPLKKINAKTGEELVDPVTEADLDNFNIYNYNYFSDNEKRTYYYIGDTGKILVIRSGNELTKKYSNLNK